MASLPSVVLAVVGKILEHNDVINFGSTASEVNRHMHNVVIYVILMGTLLLVRLLFAYARYWSAAGSLQQMHFRMYEACSSALAYSAASKAPQEEVRIFNHVLVRLFCLLHSLALDELAGCIDEDFPLLDVEGMSKIQLGVLSTPLAEGRRVEIVHQWIKIHVVKGVEAGYLTSQPVACSRVFADLAEAASSFNDAHQTVIWPFPFCYTQLTILVVFVFLWIVPFTVMVLSTYIHTCAIATLVGCMMVVGIENIASEMDHPFGHASSDLPVYEMQYHFNKRLLLMVHPCSSDVPVLSQGALDVSHMMSIHDLRCSTLGQAVSKLKRTSRKGNSTPRSSKMKKQHSWAKQSYSSSSVKMSEVLKLSDEHVIHAVATTNFLHNDGTEGGLLDEPEEPPPPPSLEKDKATCSVQNKYREDLEAKDCEKKDMQNIEQLMRDLAHNVLEHLDGQRANQARCLHALEHIKHAIYENYCSEGKIDYV